MGLGQIYDLSKVRRVYPRGESLVPSQGPSSVKGILNQVMRASLGKGARHKGVRI